MLSKNERSRVKALHTQKGRDLSKLFIAEGVKLVQEIIKTNPALIQCIYATPQFIEQNPLKNIPHQVIELNDLEAISTQQTPNQVLAVCHYLPTPSFSFNPESEVALYLDDIRDPGNLGTMVRLSDWFGMRTLFCSPHSCDWYNPKVIQSTMGAFLRVHIVYMELKEIITSYQNLKVYGAVLNGRDVYKSPLAPGIIVIGNEAHGIAPEHLSLITHPITIPSHTHNGTESLNAAMAAGMLAAEFYRQLR